MEERLRAAGKPVPPEEPAPSGLKPKDYLKRRTVTLRKALAESVRSQAPTPPAEPGALTPEAVKARFDELNATDPAAATVYWRSHAEAAGIRRHHHTRITR